jgi:hemolysin-activating ACP:hemolysin acyltransferase
MNDLEKIIYTLGLSELHKNWTTIDIINRILPPLKLKQYIFISNEKVPLFYASWAFMNQEASDAREFSKRKIIGKDWNSGHIPWIMDVICPMGGTSEGIRELKKVPRHLGVKGKIKFFRTKKGKKELHHVTWL